MFKTVFYATLIIGSLVALCYPRLEGQEPKVLFNREFKALPKTPDLTIQIEDPLTGLRRIRIVLKQEENEVILVDDYFDGPKNFDLRKTGNIKSKTYDVGKLIADKYEVQSGPAHLAIMASDYALRNFISGNQQKVERKFIFDTDPPHIESLSGIHYINQGGSECALYRVSDDTERSGIQVGSHFFPGSPVDPAHRELYFVIFAFPYNLPLDTPLTLVAQDIAGNEATTNIEHRVKPLKYRDRQIVLSEKFLQRVIPEIIKHTPTIKNQGQPIQTYVEINTRLRSENHTELAKLSEQSEKSFLWEGAFLQLSNSQVESIFADRRSYIYKGKKVDQQDHVGFDLSVVRRYPIEAANTGRVILADYFGIYGNSVLIDHGMGLVSLYAHMSSIEVDVGQMVKKREIIGKSGATGLAGGDHLHFALFLRGVPVNPIEWWDQKWIQEHVLDRLILPQSQSGSRLGSE